MKAGRLEEKIKELEKENKEMTKQKLIEFAQEYAEQDEEHTLVKIKLTEELLEEIEQEKKQIAEKAFIEGQNFATSKYDCFDDWYEDNIKQGEKTLEKKEWKLSEIINEYKKGISIYND
jgi:hypothetical protein